jgi:CHASE2 domain-containing sensor protein
MNPVNRLIQSIWLKLGRRFQGSFYLYLAALFTVVVLADGLVLNITAGLKQSSFDLMLKHRLVVAKPDPDIVIVDINEASLAAMAKEYGRWPWPRQVMGEFLEQVEKQQPKAVVFDILFSDPDVYNADSDAYFNEAIANTGNTFFPILRLDPSQDALSHVLPGQIPGAIRMPGTSGDGQPVAVVVPFLAAALQSGRLGIHNIYQDPDGIVRQYPVQRLESGWLLPSLPAKVAGHLGVKPPNLEAILLNWRGQPFTYKYTGFAEAFFDLTSKEHKRPPDEFKGKIIIIGSTAAGLFDVKPTPMDRQFPGVEIMATALDNLRHNDFLRVPEARLFNIFLALLIIWSSAIALYRDVAPEKLNPLFGASQFLLVTISYATINLVTTYINLTGPVLFGVTYFSIARLYTLAARKALEKTAVTYSRATSGDLYAALLLLKTGGSDADGEKQAVAIRRKLGRTGVKTMSVETLKGAQKGLWGLLEGMVAVSWTCPADDTSGREAIQTEIKLIEELAGASQLSENGDTKAKTYLLHEGLIGGGDKANAGWRGLLGEALQRWEKG